MFDNHLFVIINHKPQNFQHCKYASKIGIIFDTRQIHINQHPKVGNLGKHREKGWDFTLNSRIMP